MQYLGSYPQGSRLPVVVVCHDGSKTPSTPDDAPAVLVWSDSAKVEARRIAVEPGSAAGRFLGWLSLDSSYPAGRYTIQATWAVSGTPQASLRTFQVSSLGGPNGDAVAAQALDAPPHRYLVAASSLGTVRSMKNPRLP